MLHRHWLPAESLCLSRTVHVVFLLPEERPHLPIKRSSDTLQVSACAFYGAREKNHLAEMGEKLIFIQETKIMILTGVKRYGQLVDVDAIGISPGEEQTVL